MTLSLSLPSAKAKAAPLSSKVPFSLLIFTQASSMVVIVILAILYGISERNQVQPFLKTVKPKTCYKANFATGNASTELVSGHVTYCSVPSAFDLVKDITVESKLENSFCSWVILDLQFNEQKIAEYCGPDANTKLGFGAHVHSAWPFEEAAHISHDMCGKTGEHQDIARSCGPAGANVCSDFKACDCSTGRILALNDLLDKPCSPTAPRIQKRGAKKYCKVQYTEANMTYTCDTANEIPSPAQTVCQNGVVTPAFAPTVVPKNGGTFKGQRVTNLGVSSAEFSIGGDKEPLSMVFHCPGKYSGKRFACARFDKGTEVWTLNHYDQGQFAQTADVTR